MRRIFFKKKPEPDHSESYFKKFFSKKKEDQFFSASSSQGKETPEKDQVNALSKDTQKEMGAALGGDFSNVKVHTGPNAEKMNSSMNSFAFTYGKDIYFNKNMFNEKTQQGKLLLAHELVHTMQQSEKHDADWSNDTSVEKSTDAIAEDAVGKLSGGKETDPVAAAENKKNNPSTGLKIQRCAPSQPAGPAMTWIVITPKVGPGPGGWKQTTTFAGFLARFPFPRNVRCSLTIGVPIENFLGPVSDDFATDIAISSMQAVGTEMQAEMSAMDPEHVMPTEMICIEFRRRLELMMNVSIPGTRVGR